MRHAVEWVVVTSPDDAATQEVARAIPGVRLHVTDAPTRYGARFNKGLCLEEGFDLLDRDGWILVLDADILLPDSLSLGGVRPTCLYGARRRILDDPARWSPDLPWKTFPLHRDGGPIGFFQLVNGSDPAIRGKRPWYDVSFAHAGGGDAFFMRHWPSALRVILDVEVLHLGRPDMNWFGTDPESHDLMAKYVYGNAWLRAMKNFPPEAARRAGELPARVKVPGYPDSDFQLPFERRAAERREMDRRAGR